MGAEPISLGVRLALLDASSDELDRVTRTLRTQLAEQAIEAVDLVRADPRPAHTKAADAVTLGALAIVVLPAVLPKIVEFLDHFSGRNQGLMMRLKISHGDRTLELEVPMSGDTRARVEHFVSLAKQAISD